jgi:hypothetical protein
MIPDIKDLEKPRRGARMVKISSIRRNVRLYSPDLVLTAAGWAGDGDTACRKEWDRIVPHNLPPKYSDSYRKRLNLPRNFMPSTANINTTQRPVSPLSMTSEEKGLGLTPENAERFKSLTEMKWGEFEELGFSSGNTKKLEFDLTESARMQRTEKRTTMTWSDFSTSGFNRTGSPLSETLQFSQPIASTINTWPSHAEDINRKLKKSQKQLPTFGWETTPVAGPEWTVDEGIISCWADLSLSSGWTEREEGTFREANWALVEFKAIPATRSPAPFDENVDPRTDTQWFLFEEFVPREYRDQLTNPKKKRTNIFSPKKKEWKPATTLNGKPYTGRPRSPSIKEAEFDAMLSGHGHSITKVISLTPERSKTIPTPLNASTSTTGSKISGPLFTMPRSDSTPQRSPIARGFSSPAPKSSRNLFKLGKRQGIVASDYDQDLEFETRTASESSDGTVDGPASSSHPRTHNRRHSKDDGWVDILVGDSRKPGKSATSPKGNSDPELAREQIQRALDYTQQLDDAPEPIAPPVGFHDDEPTTPVIRVRPPTGVPYERGLPPHPAYNKQNTETSGYRDSDYSTNSYEPYDNGQDFEPVHSQPHSRQPTHDIEFPRYGGDEEERSPEEDQSPAPASPDEFYQHADRQDRGQSSLLDYYQERNTNGNGHTRDVSEPKPSKLPVWTGNTNTQQGSQQPTSTSSSSSSLVPPELDDETGRSSPNRYVHGLPLHNVTEEEEEY